MKKKILIGLCIFFVILIISGYVFIRSRYFAEKVRVIMQSVLEKQLGREIAVGEVTGNIFRNISIDGISIAKRDKLSDGSLAEVAEVSARYSLLNLLRFRFVIQNIIIDKPRIWLEVDKEGKLNLPELAASGGEKKKSRFSVLVSSVDIFSGQITFDDKKNSIHSFISDIHGGLESTGGQMDYSGKVRAQKVDLNVQGVSKTIFNLTSSFETSAEGVKLSDLQLEFGRSNLQVKGEILSGDLPQISMEIQSRLFLEDVNDFVFMQAGPETPLHRLDGMADIQGVVVGEMPDIAGMFKIEFPVMHVNDLEIQKVDAEVKFTRDTLSLTEFSADLAEGSANLSGEVQLVNGKPSEYAGTLNLEHLSVGGLVSAINGSETPISGYLSGEFSMSGTELRPEDINVDAGFSMLDTGWKDNELDIKLGTVEASLAVEGGAVVLDASRGEAAVNLEAKLSNSGEVNLLIDVSGLDLGEMTSLATGSPSAEGKGHIGAEVSLKIVHPEFRKAVGLPAVDLPAGLIEGVADLRAQANIDISDIGLSVKMSSNQDSGQEIDIPSPEYVEIGSLTGTINLIDDRLRIAEMILQKNGSESRIEAEVQIKESPIVDAKLALNSLKIEDYIGLAGEGEFPLSGGMVNGELAVRGEIMDLKGNGQISVTELTVAGRDIHQISLPIEVESNTLTIPNLVVSSLGEEIRAACSISQSGDYSLQVDSSLIDLSKMAPDDLPISGTVQVSLSGSGNVASPMVKGKLELKALGYNGEDFGNGECAFDLMDDKVRVDVSLSDQTLIATLEGGIQPPFPFSGIIQLGNIDLEPALKMAGLDEKMDLHITGSIDLDGTGATPMDSSIDATLQTLLIDLDGDRWANETPVSFGFHDGRARIDSLTMKGATGQLSVNGGFGMTGDVGMEVNVEKLDLAAISKMLELPETISGSLDCMVKVQGEAVSPSAEVGLDISELAYQQVSADRISAQVLYENGTVEVENLTLNISQGEVRLKALLPLELDPRNPPTPDQIMDKPINASVDAENLDLSFLLPLVPELKSAEGKIDDVHLEVSGPLTSPNISGDLALKNARLQLETLPTVIENLNGTLSIQSLGSRGTLSQNIDYEASLGMDWDIEDGKYGARGSARIPRSFIQSLLTSASPPANQNNQPEFRFDMEIQDGQLGSLITEMAGDQLPPLDGHLSMELHVDGFLVNGQAAKTGENNVILLPNTPLAVKDLRGYLTIDPLDLTANGYEVRNRNPISISFENETLSIPTLQLTTLTPLTGNADRVSAGSIAMSGKISMDKKLKLELSGEELNPGLFSAMLNPSMPMKGDLTFQAKAEGRLDSPTMIFSLTGTDLSVPVSSSGGEMKIDKILCDMSYRDDTFEIKQFHIDSFGNQMDVNGTLPVDISVLPTEVVFPDQQANLKMVMDNFNLAFLSHFSEEIQEVRGNAKADIRMSGSMKSPRLTGDLELLDVFCRLMIDRSKLAQTNVMTEGVTTPASQPMDIENINVNVSLTGDMINGKMGFRIGGGQYESKGEMALGEGLKPQAFKFTFGVFPARLDPFLALMSQDLKSQISGEITANGWLEGDIRELQEKPILESLKTLSGEMLISSEGIKIDASGHTFTNPKQISAKFRNGNLDVPSLKIVDKSLGSKRASSISALGGWQIDGEKSFDATIDLDMGLVSKLIRRPDSMSGWLTFKIQGRGEEIKCSWPPANVKGNQNLSVESAAIDRFRGNVIYRDQEILVERVHISSEKNHIILSGSVPMTEEKMNLRLDARLDDMGILSFVNRDITESSGSGIIGATITGNLRKVIAKEEPVRFVGSCRFSDLGVNFDRAYMKFEGLKFDVEFDSQSLGSDRGFVALKTFRGKMNDGEFYLSSEASVNPGAEIIWEKGKNFRIGEFRGISVKMTDFLLNDPMVYSAKFGGEVSLKGTFDAPEIAGDVTVDSGEYVESMDNLVQRLLSTREIGVKAFLDYPLVQDLQLNIEVRAPGNVWMKNEIVDAQAKVTARVRGSLADPIVMAQVNIVNGKIYYFGPEFEIIEGSIKNESRIDPQYDITAEMEITSLGDADTSASGSSKQTLEMKLKGSLSEVQPPVFTLQGGGVTQQRYTMSSEDKDIMTILTLGSTSDEFLSKTAEWYLGNKAAKRLSLKEFQMQVDLNINDPKETRLMVARQLMDRMSVRLDVGYRGQQWIGLQYEMSKHLGLAGELSQYGDWGLDLEIKRDFQ